MKKILTLLTLLSAFLLTACGPSYNYESPEKFVDSLEKQAKEEKLSDEEAIQIVVAYATTLFLENSDKIVDGLISEILEADSVKDLLVSDGDTESVECLKPIFEGKTFADMKNDASPILLKLAKDHDSFAMKFMGAIEKGLK